MNKYGYRQTLTTSYQTVQLSTVTDTRALNAWKWNATGALNLSD